MARISTYPLDSSITKNDKLIGTDGDDNSVTKNFAVDTFAEYVKSKILPYSTFSFFIDRNSSGVISITEHMNDTGLTFTFAGAVTHIDMTASSNITNSKVSFISTCHNAGSGQGAQAVVALFQPKYLASNGTALSRLIPVTPFDSATPVEFSAWAEFKIYN